MFLSMQYPSVRDCSEQRICMTEVHLCEYNLVYIHVPSISGMILGTVANLDNGFIVIAWQRCFSKDSLLFVRILTIDVQR